MKLINRSIFIFLIIFICGCRSSYQELNALHRKAEFNSNIVTESAWELDMRNMGVSHNLEILSFGGQGAGSPTNQRMTGDYYSVFENNSKSLMTSLFGRSDSNFTVDNEKYIFRPQIVKVHSVARLNAFADASFEIDIKFTLIFRQGDTEKIIFDKIIKGRSDSTMGISTTYEQNAHKRANDAINHAFTAVHQMLISQLNTK
jgi:hypothetical protein